MKRMRKSVVEMPAIEELTVEESVHVDGAFFCELTVELGDDAAREVVGDAIAAMSSDLAAIELACAEGRAADLVVLCDSLSRVAWELGLTTLSAVVIDLALCTERGDPIAIAAVRGRLRRVGAQSLVAAWDEAASG